MDIPMDARVKLEYAALALVLLATAAGCSDSSKVTTRDGIKLLNSSSCPAPTDPPIHTMVSSAIADPSILNGKYISITGYLCAGFEKSSLYETPNCDAPAYTGLWISGVTSDIQFHGDRVEIVGRFDSALKGHLDQWPGTVCVYSLNLTDPKSKFRPLEGPGKREL